MPSLKNDVEKSAPTTQNDDAYPSKWQLNMNLNVLNRRKRKLLSKCQVAYICFALISITIIASLIVLVEQIQLLSKDVDVLKSQIELLKLKYRYDSQQNRSRLRRLAHYGLVGSINPFVPEFSNLTEEERVDSKFGFIKDDRVSVTDATTLTPNFYSDQQTSLFVTDRSMDRENNTFESTTTSAVLYNDIVTTSPRTPRNDSPIVDLEESRNLSSDTMIREMQNRTVRHTTIDDGNELSLWREPRARRLQRDQGRGKKRRKNRRRPNRSRRRLGPLVATFIGAIPEQHVTNSAIIGPWIKSDHDDKQYNLTKFHLVEKNMAIEITTKGLYLISVQIFYFGESTKHSYWILLNSEGLSKAQKLVKCATTTSNVSAEVSCYTSIIMYMQRGDRLHIEQQERDRLINMREGYSHIQLVLLANDMQGKRSS